MMLTKIQKWGNSQGVRFSKEILRKAHISIGDNVNISFTNGKIVVKLEKASRKKYKIKDLLSQMPEKYETKEVEWGNSIGKEVW